MQADEFLENLQSYAASFATTVSTDEGDWIVKGFIDIYKRVFTISVDTKITSKVLELLLFPLLVEFAKSNDLRIEMSPHQNFYPDLTFIHEASGGKFAVDIKSTYRTDGAHVNGMTLGAFTGYFRKRDTAKNTLYPYGQYSGHFVLGVIYSKCDGVIDERKTFTLDNLPEIPSVIKGFQFFAQPKFRVASARPGSGNTKNIGSVTEIDRLAGGHGPFAKLGEEVYDDYWMFYLTRDKAQAAGIDRPYTNLKEYLAYKERGVDKLRLHHEEIANFGEEESAPGEDAENGGEDV